MYCLKHIKTQNCLDGYDGDILYNQRLAILSKHVVEQSSSIIHWQRILFLHGTRQTSGKQKKHICTTGYNVRMSTVFLDIRHKFLLQKNRDVGKDYVSFGLHPSLHIQLDRCHSHDSSLCRDSNKI